MRDVRLNVTTDADGDATATSAHAILGRLIALEWIDGDLADGVDATVSVVNSTSGVDRTVLTLTDANADAFYHTGAAVYGATGAAITNSYAAPLIDGKLKLTVASGGSAKSGGAILWVD